MKRVYLIILTFILILLYFETSISQSQCPSGWSSTTKVYTINGCDYQIEFCYRCYVTQPSHVRVVGFKKLNPMCNPSPSLSSSELLEYITDRLTTDYQTIHSICSNEEIPPCDPLINPYVVEIGENRCWRKETLPNGVVEYWACYWYGAYCFTQWHLCFDSFGVLQRTLNIGPMWAGDISDCPNEEPVDPPIGQSTDCFYILTRCD